MLHGKLFFILFVRIRYYKQVKYVKYRETSTAATTTITRKFDKTN